MTKINLLVFIIISSIFVIELSNATKFLNTNYTLDFVKNIEIVKCTPHTECPHYSGGCHVIDVDMHSSSYGTGYCNFAFICSEDKTCVVEKKEELLYSNNSHNYLNTQTYDLKEGFSEIEGDYYVSSCFVDDINHVKTFIEHNNCQINDNCYTGSCFDGTCLSDKENPVYHCILDYPDTKKSPVIKCKNIQYKCESGSTCSSNYCNNYKRDEMYTEQELDGTTSTNGAFKKNEIFTLYFSFFSFFPLLYFLYLYF
ncbi:hypothetical protein BCR32DRAFT_330944, partial [Anaeromyces robustus]